MAVYTLGNISTQIKFWKMISMQFVQVRSQNRSVPSRGGRYGKNISTFHDFITILCHVSFTILSEHYGQTNFPIIKTKPFKVTEYKKEWWIFRPKWVKIKIVVIILSLLLKIRTKMHITNTHNIQIKKVFYFQVQQAYLAGAFKKLSEQI